MNPRVAMMGLFGLGIAATAFAVKDTFDDRIVYCQPVVPCQQRIAPAWMQIQGEIQIQGRLPGAAGRKLVAAVIGAGAFAAAMHIARTLAAAEPQKQKLQAIWEDVEIRFSGMLASESLRQFHNQLMQQAADAAFAAMPPILRAQLMGSASLETTTDPSDKLEGVEEQALAENQKWRDTQQEKDAVTPFDKDTATPKEKDAVNYAQPEQISRHGCKLFNWNKFKTHPDLFPHIRIVAKSGLGKTTLADWLLDILGGERFVITIKRKRHNWRGLKVYGLTRNYEACRSRLQWVLAEMDRRFDLIENSDIDPPMTNFVVDEWRSISQNVKQVKDPDTGEVVSLSAKEMMKEIITLARDAKLRMIALAQGKQVKTWGLEDESDLEECFTTIRMGQFAIDYVKALRNNCRRDSDEYDYWSAVLAELADQGDRCCMVDDMPACIPDLSNWQRQEGESLNWLERTKAKLEEYLHLEGFTAESESENAAPDLDDDLGEPVDEAFDESEAEEQEEDGDVDTQEPQQPHLSVNAHKLVAWMGRRMKKTGQAWFSVNDVQTSKTIKGAKADDIRNLFNEIVDANMGVLNEQGFIRLL